MGKDAQIVAGCHVNVTVDIHLGNAPSIAIQCLHICTMSSPFGDSYYQLAFLTPGMFPSRAFILNGNYTHYKHPGRPRRKLFDGFGLTLAILKSLNTPLDFPPSIHLLLICVDLV